MSDIKWIDGIIGMIAWVVVSEILHKTLPEMNEGIRLGMAWFLTWLSQQILGNIAKRETIKEDSKLDKYTKDIFCRDHPLDEICQL